MAVNQSQVDHIITAASEDDPEVKLQNLEREVDLIKTSIKRLLMDIRERMNEMENPLSLTASGSPGAGADSLSTDAGEARKSALEAREAALDARESQMEAEQAKMETESRNETPPPKPVKAEPVYSAGCPSGHTASERGKKDAGRADVCRPEVPDGGTSQKQSRGPGPCK